MSRTELDLSGTMIEWRGPAPYYFVGLSEEDSADIKTAAAGLEYWGQVPVTVRIRDIAFTTALFPKDGRYLVPVKAAVRGPLALAVGDTVDLRLGVGTS